MKTVRVPMQFTNMEIDLSNFQEMNGKRQVHTAFLFALISFIEFTLIYFTHLLLCCNFRGLCKTT